MNLSSLSSLFPLFLFLSLSLENLQNHLPPKLNHKPQFVTTKITPKKKKLLPPTTTTKKPNHNNQNQENTHPKIKPHSKKKKKLNYNNHHPHTPPPPHGIYHNHQNHISIPTNAKQKPNPI